MTSTNFSFVAANRTFTETHYKNGFVWVCHMADFSVIITPHVLQVAKTIFDNYPKEEIRGVKMVKDIAGADCTVREAIAAWCLVREAKAIQLEL